MSPVWGALLSSSGLQVTRQDAVLPRTLISAMLLTHLPDHGSWSTLPVLQTEDQPQEPASELTWWGVGGNSRELEVQKGGVWPDL